MPLFSIIIVCLNPGEKLRLSLESVVSQSCLDYEVVIKDGESLGTEVETTVAAMAAEMNHGQIRMIVKKDRGIYDAMNQAVAQARGEYIYFLNCGDELYDKSILQIVADRISKERDKQSSPKLILYGNIVEQKTQQTVMSNPSIDDFGCYRNVPCHQACFYTKDLLVVHPFEIVYQVRADYEHFLWCYYQGEAKLCYIPSEIAFYEGGGFSETKANRMRSKEEHRRITEKYMTRKQIFKYRLIMFLTLAPLRTKIAENKKTATIYQKLKKLLYRKGL